MTTNKFQDKDLSLLQAEKGNICVSIIVPAHRLSPERRADKPELEKAIEKAGQLLFRKYSKNEAEPLLKAVDELYKTIDFTYNPDGFGLYVSLDIKLLVRFPFPVEEKVMVGDYFELRDLLYKENYAKPYFVLLLTEKGGRLLEGRWNNLLEIKDRNFPMKYEDDYAYSKPARSSSLAGYAHVKDFEKDRSEIEAIRLKDFFRKLDKTLDKYLFKDHPLIILGVEKDLSFFNAVSHHTQNIIYTVAGSYNYDNEKQLSDLAWPAMRTHLETEWKKLVKEFEEKIGRGLGVTGIQDIWRAVQEGKALKLLVEKDYRQSGFLAENKYDLYLHPTKKTIQERTDVVDDIIETVLEKNGFVHVVDNGILKDHDRIALITRY